MKLTFTEEGWLDYLWFQETDRKLLKKINKFIEEIKRTPYEGTGKPEPLKHDLSGYWRRKIDGEHRLVYEVSETEVTVIQCRHHYKE